MVIRFFAHEHPSNLDSVKIIAQHLYIVKIKITVLAKAGPNLIKGQWQGISDAAAWLGTRSSEKEAVREFRNLSRKLKLEYQAANLFHMPVQLMR